MPTNAERLARIQAQLGNRSYGIYIGIESAGWRAPDFAAKVAQPYAALGANKPDYVVVKCGEYGTEWYDGTFPAIRQVFLAAGIGCAPYIFARPNTWQADAQIAAKLAREAGIVILDCEEQFNAFPGQLDQHVATVRNLAGPDPVIIVSGYGDPQTAVPGWDFHCLQYADGYQPQWYVGVWDLYRSRGFQAAVMWGDGQIAQRFQSAGLGTDYPIQPAMGVQGMNFADLGPLAGFLENWHASVTVWEMQLVQPAMFAAFRAAVGRNTPAPSAPPPPSPAPAPQPAPTPAPGPRTYIVKAADTLSKIAQAFYGNAALWTRIWNANRGKIPNPNLIYVGETLIIP